MRFVSLLMLGGTDAWLHNCRQIVDLLFESCDLSGLLCDDTEKKIELAVAHVGEGEDHVVIRSDLTHSFFFIYYLAEESF